MANIGKEGTAGKVSKKPVRRVSAAKVSSRAKAPSSELGSRDALVRKPAHEEIERLAYEYYLAEGCPEGQSHSHWQRAEAHLLATVS